MTVARIDGEMPNHQIPCMVDYTKPLEHFAFADRGERARHEREGTPDTRATRSEVKPIGQMAIDVIGYPYVIEILSPEGARDVVFANPAGRIANRPAEYVANRHDDRAEPPSGASENEK